MIERTTPDAFVTEARAVLARHAAERAERERVGEDACTAPYRLALRAVHQAECEALARQLLALCFPTSRRPLPC